MSKRPSRGVSSGIGTPIKMDGRDGDFTIRKTREGKILYVKEHGRWHPINTGVDVVQLKKDVDRLIRSVVTLNTGTNLLPSLTEVNIRKYSDGTGVKLTNDSGVLKIRNLADTADVVVKAKRLQVDTSTAGLTGAVVGEFQYNTTGDTFYGHSQGLVIDAATTGDSGDVCTLIILSHTEDALLKFYENVSPKWTTGYDKTDGKFKINSGGLMVDTSDFMLDTDGNLTVAGNVISTAGTLGVGDITGVTLTGDSGGALSDTSGSADFTIAGGTNCASAGSGSTITVNVDDAFIVNNAADIMAVSDFGANAAFKIDADQPATAGAEDSVGLWIDYVRAVATSDTENHNDTGIDLDVTAATEGTGAVKGMDIDVVGATNGTHTAIGIDLDVDSADTNIGMIINTAGTHMKLVANADTDDYATLTVADTGDLTIATVGDGTTDSDLVLDADGDIILEAAGGNINADATVAITSTNPDQFKVKYDGSNYGLMNVASDGHLEIESVGTDADMTLRADGAISIIANDGSITLNPSSNIVNITASFGESSTMTIADTTGIFTIASTATTPTTADIILDAGGNIELDSGNGVFIAKKSGTEFSASKSAYAGMILGMTCVGVDVADDSYDLTTSYVVPDVDEFRIVFITPPSEFVEIVCSISFGASSSGQDLFMSLSNDATYGSNSLTHPDQFENVIWNPPGRGTINQITARWVIQPGNLAAVGSSNSLFIAAKTDNVSGTPKIYWGGDATDEYAPLIIKAIALPIQASISVNP